jgi:integrase
VRVSLTDRFAHTAAPTPGKIDRYFDTDKRSPRGFLLRITSSGTGRAWALQYREKDGGRQREITIGDTKSWPISDARKHGHALRRRIDAGADPLAEREARRAAPIVDDLWHRFEAEALPARAERTRAEYRAMWRDYVQPSLGRLKAAAVTREHVERLHRRITEQGKPRRANAVKSFVSMLFNEAIVWRWCERNPCQGVKANTEHRRERFLSAEQIGGLMREVECHRALGGHWTDTTDQVELAVYTGARRGEILGMTWAQIDDLDGAATWVLPSMTTKEGKRHGRSKRLPLSEGAVAVLRRRREERDAGGNIVRLRDDHVFRHGNSQAGVGALERDWRVLRACAQLESTRYHDLRHSYASLLVNEGLSLEIIGKLLGHAKIQSTQRYAHLSDAPLRQATELVAKKVGRRGER